MAKEGIMYTIFLVVAQIALLVLWSTALTVLSAWIIFIPAMLYAIEVIVTTTLCGAAIWLVAER